MTGYALETRNISKNFGALRVANNISLKLVPGARQALIGPNGAGKTTLLRLIAGELPADGGTVSVGGGLGVMPQFVGSLADDRTVRDLLVSVAPPRLRQADRDRALALARLARNQS